MKKQQFILKHSPSILKSLIISNKGWNENYSELIDKSIKIAEELYEKLRLYE